MSAADPRVTIRLLGLPVELHRRASEHQEALRRELAFVEHAPDSAPVRLQALTAQLQERYGRLSQAQDERLNKAGEAGEEHIDLEYELPPDVVDASLRASELLDELDEYCLKGELLTLVTPAELLAYRRWFLGEFVAQLRDGREPRAWTSVGAVTPGSEPPRQGGRHARVEVQDDLDLGSAPELRSRLTALADAGVTHLTLDMSGCRFLDSTGLSLLVATHRRLVEAGGGLRVEEITAPVQSLLEMSGATQLFERG